jgi:sugar lactone lactonase YvrE
MAVGANGTLYFADSGNMRVRAISPRGIISTIAGYGTFGWVTTGTPARAARLGWPAALTIGPHGDLYIAAEGSGEVLRLGANGLLVRVAGIRGPFAGVYGIGRPATQASADGPNGLAFDRAGNLYIAGVNTKTLLMVTPGGRMVLPMGQDGFYPRGDGGLVTAPDGSVIAMDGQKIVRLSPRGARTILNLGGRRIDGISGFLPDGIAVAPTGDIFADTYLGNGLANKTALIEVRPGGRIQVLWKS